MFSGIHPNDLIFPAIVFLCALLMMVLGSPPSEGERPDGPARRSLGAWDWTSWPGTIAIVGILSSLTYIWLAVWKLLH